MATFKKYFLPCGLGGLARLVLITPSFLAVEKNFLVYRAASLLKYAGADGDICFRAAKITVLGYALAQPWLGKLTKLTEKPALVPLAPKLGGRCFDNGVRKFFQMRGVRP